MVSNYTVPPKFDEAGPYECWKNEVSIWRHVTELEKKKQALTVALGLEGRARETTLEIPAEDLNKDDGMETLLAKLDALFLKEEKDRAYEAYSHFDSILKDSAVSMADYINDFEQRYNRMKKYNMTLPDAVLAFKLLDTACVEEKSRKLALIACTELTFPSMKSALKRIFGGKTGGTNNGGESQDAGFFTEQRPTDGLSLSGNQRQPQQVLDLMEHLFQGQLVLRTRCLECESFTERREDFQDISVPVLDEQPASPEDLSEISPDPKPELKTLNWAIGQFASVEHIFGEDKYYCETCHHYTEAERSLLFDKTPEVITIHLKRFSANALDLDLYAGLSKVNTPLQTPLNLCLDEWCTRRSAKGQNYELFAVVMHSGVTISSGHYTAFVRMSDLRDVKLWSPQDSQNADRTEAAEKDELKPEKKVKDEAPDYDDGEVSFSRAQRGGNLTKTGSKKVSEGSVGLLGGQRSLSACELKQDKATSDGNKRRKTLGSAAGQSAEVGLKKAQDSLDPTEVQASSEDKASESKALSRLLEYEGKWMLFDDSEVRMFDEEDFLRACSPETASSSTPYLLFYRRTPKL